jgi:hypothetical protein
MFFPVLISHVLRFISISGLYTDSLILLTLNPEAKSKNMACTYLRNYTESHSGKPW